MQVNPEVYNNETKSLKGLAWLLAQHKLRYDRRLGGRYLEGQRKRQKTDEVSEELTAVGQTHHNYDDKLTGCMQYIPFLYLRALIVEDPFEQVLKNGLERDIITCLDFCDEFQEHGDERESAAEFKLPPAVKRDSDTRLLLPQVEMFHAKMIL